MDDRQEIELTELAGYNLDDLFVENTHEFAMFGVDLEGRIKAAGADWVPLCSSDEGGPTPRFDSLTCLACG